MGRWLLFPVLLAWRAPVFQQRGRPGEQLREAITHIHGQIQERDAQDEELTEDDEYLPADLAVRNYSYTAIDGRIYYRENSIMRPVSVSDAAAKRLMGLINIQRSVRRLIDLQMAEDTGDEVIRSEQEKKKLKCPL